MKFTKSVLIPLLAAVLLCVLALLLLAKLVDRDSQLSQDPRSGGIAALRAGKSAIISEAVAQPVAENARLPAPPKPDVPAKLRDWTWIYVTSYDNNLDNCTLPITRDLRKGLKSDSVAVTILTDRPDTNGLIRQGFTQLGADETRLATDDITDPDAIGDYLTWAVKAYPAAHYVVVFLDHGGRLDQMCADEHAGPSADRPGWLSASKVGPVMAAWASNLKIGKVELLFLQQCGRASIENLYNFRDVSPLLMGSQTTVGACNTYYEASVEETSRADPKLGGETVAKAIMREDAHYRDYVLIRSDALRQAKEMLEPVAKELLSVPADKFVKGSDGMIVPCFPPGADPRSEETNFDLLDYLRVLYEANGLDATKSLIPLRKWVAGRLIVQHRFQSQRAQAQIGDKWCGASMHVPRSAWAQKPYANLPLYKDSLWGALAVRLAEARAATK